MAILKGPHELEKIIIVCGRLNAIAGKDRHQYAHYYTIYTATCTKLF